MAFTNSREKNWKQRREQYWIERDLFHGRERYHPRNIDTRENKTIENLRQGREKHWITRGTNSRDKEIRNFQPMFLKPINHLSIRENGIFLNFFNCIVFECSFKIFTHFRANCFQRFKSVAINNNTLAHWRMKSYTTTLYHFCGLLLTFEMARDNL